MASWSLNWDPPPPRGPNAPKVPSSQWELHRPYLNFLYIANNWKLDDVMVHMRNERKFTASERQYTLQFKKWGFSKKNGLGRWQSVTTDSSNPSARPALSPALEPASNSSYLKSDVALVSLDDEDVDGPHTYLTSGQPTQSSRVETTPTRLVPDSCGEDVEIEGVEPESVRAISDTAMRETSLLPMEGFKIDTKLLHDAPLVPTVSIQPEVQDPWTLGALEMIEEETPAIEPSTDGAPSTEFLNVNDKSSKSFLNFSDDAQKQWLLPEEIMTDVNSAHTAKREIRKQDTVGELDQGSQSSGFDRAHTPSAFLEEEDQMPVLTEPSPLTRHYRLSTILRGAKEHWMTKVEISPKDLTQLHGAAKFLSAARCYEDAFILYGTVLTTTMAESDFEPGSSPIVGIVSDMVKSATTDASRNHISWLMKNVISKRKYFLPPKTTAACLLHAHLGNCFREVKDLHLAKRHCRLGLDQWRKLRFQLSGYQIILLTSLVAVLQENGEEATAQTYQKEVLQPTPMENESCSANNATEMALRMLFHWVAWQLNRDDFFKWLENANEDLWRLNPTVNDLAEFETTVLFCYLWTQRLQTQWLPHGYLADIETSTGITSMEALAATSVLILGLDHDPALRPHDTSLRGRQCILEADVQHWDIGADDGPFEKFYRRPGTDVVYLLDELPSHKSTLARRARTLSLRFTQVQPKQLFHAFLQAHASTIRNKSGRFSTEAYAALVQEYVREIADSHLVLDLSTNPFRDVRMKPVVHRASQSSSLCPTLLSNPCSSWSGWASFRSLSRRANPTSHRPAADEQPLTSNNRRLSNVSSSFSRRWSMFSSVGNFRSSMDDVSMQDVS